MKTITIKLFLALTFLFLFSACELLEEIDDSSSFCDKTAFTPWMEVTFNTKVWIDNVKDNITIPIKVEYYKIACGKNELDRVPESTHIFIGELSKKHTDRTTGPVGYQLRNSGDIIYIKVYTDPYKDGSYVYLQRTWKFDSDSFSFNDHNKKELDYRISN